MIVDVHTHMVTEDYLNLLRRDGGPKYTFRTLPAGGEVIDKDGVPFFTLLPAMWDFDQRIRDMDAAGVDVAVISLTSPNAIFADGDLSRTAARLMNDAFAEARTAHPDRLRWFASLPWTDPSGAVEELSRAVSLGASGVFAVATVDGRPLTDPAYAPIWEAIDTAGLPVFLHPSVPPGEQELGLGDHNLSPPVGFVFDTTLAISRMLYDGFFERYRQLSMILAHGGGTLPFLIGRLDVCHDRIPACAAGTAQPPSAFLDRLYLDSVVYSKGALDLCIETVGADRILFGSDYPHNIGDMAGRRALLEASGAPHRKTAAALFGL
ncbi:amidohydrolase family protein [Maritimibacter sp. UBA3975]|uniref:amidohydrolase family protein n=1 Tax=Maritimibacter sp. UBA3975 TaxID=1946833 RepID=UPI000C09BBCB|nr:amidohydrolase family protein [Maritimibacter sp. UBA3975]MAM61549.1 2-amino-3-carboxymuconate-6-semialdehyde decarboxylase [Maritimibacter sp.]|tara:strand:- start:19325 stop:20290 length:966 start_codon:yes stop_codon:yes gene_type:complete